MRWFVFLAVLAASAPVFGQVSAEEAQKKLAEKQAARQAERSKVVTITQGELDDLKAEVARLKAENAQLKAGQSQAGPASTTPAVKLVQKIAVGNSKAEVERFVQVHKTQYVVLSDQPSPGDATRETIVIECKAKRKVYDGKASNGVQKYSTYHEEMRPDSHLDVVLLNGVVSSVNETKLPLQRDERDPGR